MKFLLFLGIVIICFMLYALKYRNPYKLIIIFGKKGSGKTTLLTKLCLQYQKAGRPCYSNVAVPGAYLINAMDLGFYSLPPESVVFIDEASMYWDNRNFKNFKKEYQDYFRYQRQYRHTVYLLSQSFDVDKKLRDLADGMYLVRCWFNVLSVARRVNKTITIVHADKGGTGESHIADDLDFDSLLLFWAGAVRVTWIPKYSKYFKSFNPPPLPEGKETVLCPMPELPYHNRKEYVLYVLHNLRSFAVRSLLRVKGFVSSLPVFKIFGK